MNVTALFICNKASSCTKKTKKNTIRAVKPTRTNYITEQSTAIYKNFYNNLTWFELINLNWCHNWLNLNRTRQIAMPVTKFAFPIWNRCRTLILFLYGFPKLDSRSAAVCTGHDGGLHRWSTKLIADASHQLNEFASQLFQWFASLWRTIDLNVSVVFRFLFKTLSGGCPRAEIHVQILVSVPSKPKRFHRCVTETFSGITFNILLCNSQWLFRKSLRLLQVRYVSSDWSIQCKLSFNQPRGRPSN